MARALSVTLQLVYDLRVQPFSVGDLLTHMQAALCLVRPAETFDTVVVHDQHRYTAQDSKLRGIQFDRDIPWLMSTARCNKRLGSLALTDARFFKPAERSWPLVSRYTTYDCWQVILKYFQEWGRIPQLEPPIETQDWAERFMEKHGRITVQLRRNPMNPVRDSDYGEWRVFLDRYREEQFIVICAKHEKDAFISTLPNVTYACDHADMERSLALVWAADMHLGVASGPAQMRWYNGKPFAIFKEPVNPDRVSGMERTRDGVRMPWHTERQRLLTGSDDITAIEREWTKVKHEIEGVRGERTAGTGGSVNAHELRA